MRGSGSLLLCSHYAFRDVDRMGRVKADAEQKRAEDANPGAAATSADADAAAAAASVLAAPDATAAAVPPPGSSSARFSAGSFYGDLQDFLLGEDTSQFGFTPYSSMVISRRRDDPLDRLGAETFVAARFLYGALPDALLSQYQVSQMTTRELTCVVRLRALPKNSEQDVRALG